jgi:hypothetical protein
MKLDAVALQAKKRSLALFSYKTVYKLKSMGLVEFTCCKQDERSMMGSLGASDLKSGHCLRT